jgi:hypothetical protein
MTCPGIHSGLGPPGYFFPARYFAHRAFWAFAIFALAAALSLRLVTRAPSVAGAPTAPKIFASSFSSLVILSFKLAASLNW